MSRGLVPSLAIHGSISFGHMNGKAEGYRVPQPVPPTKAPPSLPRDRQPLTSWGHNHNSRLTCVSPDANPESSYRTTPRPQREHRKIF